MRQPVWIDSNRAEKQRLRASSCSVDLSVTDIPKATLTLEPDQDMPNTHDMVQLYRGDDDLGIFRVVSYGYTHRQNVVLQLMGMVDVLNDDVYELEADEEETKTASAWIRDILSRQRSARWTLGTCAMSENIPLKINYQTIWTLLEEIRQYQTGYMWTYDFSVYPWRLNLVKMSDTVMASFRVTRNVESAKITVTDQDLVNKLICSVSNTDGTVTTIVKQNTQSQNKYGVRTRCTDIKADQIPRGMTADQYASAVLKEHQDPITSIQISGMDLHEITGDDYDRITLGSQVEAVIPGYNTGISQRVMALSYPDILNTPERLTVQMSTEIKPITGSLAGAKQMVSAVKAVRGGGGGGGGGKADTESWSKVLTKTIDAVDGTGITEIWQSGIVANAQTGVRIFSLYQGVQSIQSELNVNTEGISTLVTKTGINSLGQGETMYSKITQTEAAIQTEVSRATGAEGTLSSRITQTADKVSVVVDDSGNLKRAALILSITNGTSNASISADVIDIDGIVTALSTKNLNVGEVHAGVLDGRSVLTDGVEMGGETFTVMDFTVDGVHKAYFLGTGDVDFDRAAAQREGVNDVYISPSDIQMIDSSYELNGGAPYYDVEIEASTTSTLFPTLSDTGTQMIRVSAAEAYADGAASVAQRTVNGIAVYGAPSYASGTCTQPCTVTFSDGNTQRNANTTINTTDSYNLGRNSVSQRTVNGISAYGTPSYASGTCTQPCTVTFSDGNTQRNANTTLNATSAYNLGHTAGHAAGYAAGWAAARAKCYRSGNQVYRAPETVDGSAAAWFKITVDHGTMTFTKVGSNVAASASIYAKAGGTIVDTSSVSGSTTV